VRHGWIKIKVPADQRLSAKIWCYRQFGPGHDNLLNRRFDERHRWSLDEVTFAFKLAEDATMFALKFGGNFVARKNAAGM